MSGYLASFFFLFEDFFIAWFAKSTGGMRFFIAAFGAANDGWSIMLSMHTLIAAFTEAVRGVFFKLAALDAFNSRRHIGSTILANVTGFTKPSSSTRLQFRAIGANDLPRFVSTLVKFLVATLAIPFCIMRSALSAPGAFYNPLGSISPCVHILSSHSSKLQSICQGVFVFSNYCACHESR